MSKTSEKKDNFCPDYGPISAPLSGIKLLVFSALAQPQLECCICPERRKLIKKRRLGIIKDLC